MKAIKYLDGDATQPAGHGAKITAHVVNDKGLWGSGFTRSVSARWVKAEQDYRSWHRGYRNAPGAEKFELGNTRYTFLGDNGSRSAKTLLWVAHMVAQSGVRDPSTGYLRPLRYDALGACLLGVGRMAKLAGASVHMPRIGCGLGGGEWVIVKELINDALCREGVDVYVYDWGR